MSELAQALFQAVAKHGRPGDSRQMAGDAPPIPPQMLAEALANMAKGTGAGLAGMPVDLMTTAMRPFGYDVEQPVGSSDWFGGLMGADTDSGAFMAGQFASPDPMDAARVASYGPELQNLIEAMTVFHGSPHKWDRVDLSKVGTGEGAQAFGHGFYAAEKKGVAKAYADPKDFMTDSSFFTNPQGQEIVGDFPDVRDAISDQITANLSGFMDDDIQDAIDYVAAAKLGQATKPPEVPESLLAAMNEAAEKVTRRPGHLYELDLPDETIDKMLDWDKPLSEQPESVRAALEQIGITSDKAGLDEFDDALLSALNDNAPSSGLPKQPPNPTGEEIYRRVSTQAYKSGAAPERSSGVLDPQAAASRRLAELGIPGIRYLDGISRTAGDGTRNFVIFDESYIKPLTRNGQPIKE